MKIRWIGLGVSALLAVVAVAVGFGVGILCAAERIRLSGHCRRSEA